jgi:hypothetical protein
MKSVFFNKPKVLNVNPVDQWVGDGAERHVTEATPEHVTQAAPEEDIPMKRFTIDVPASLHKRIKTQCAADGIKMADMLREMLETRFPAKS